MKYLSDSSAIAVLQPRIAVKGRALFPSNMLPLYIKYNA